MNRIDVVRTALAGVENARYLEIGVKDGECFDAIDATTKVAVDPRFAFRPPLGPRLRSALWATTGTLYFRTTSDAFFDGPARRLAPFDVVFVDGLHTYEQAYRDVVHALSVLRAGGVVIVHDCSPSSAAAAAPTLAQAGEMEGYVGEWNGDVFKAIVRLRTHPDLRVSVLDCDQGVGIVTRGATRAPLELALPEIERLAYPDLERHRARLLDLRPASDLAALLEARRG
ncbi:MAG TPA: class I SAM-dependent methyltransferase [Gaiella sp.]|uniref:class I SAM-dependent methyltransferase n=1 Tax=Gaiella sp. TaxID=2663207 RepID=UPI002D7FD754|nr:class I SAM-dependent methyltransferase [Gaiella sp.]HET9286516.1 class I SAM-dependent methyltransferase [Gaiella sp.]